ncbi:MAG: hypothetical protein M3063_10895 [Actinomycetota bacterium]|nr:hypothetical protein [Actinomycetota bacterium]
MASLVVPVASSGQAMARADDPRSRPPHSLRVVGKSDLGAGGLNGPVAVVGDTAIVGSGINPSGGVHTGFYNPYPCPATTVKLVDLGNPRHPRVAGTIPVAAGVSALDVAAIHVRTPSFTGDLGAVALAICGSAGGSVDRGVAYYDITHPANPVFLGRYQADSEGFTPGLTCGPTSATTDPSSCSSSQHSVAMVQRPDGKVLSLSTEPFATASQFPSGDLRVVDVTNPMRPAQVASFPATDPAKGFSNNGCRPFSAGHDAVASKDGSKALLAYLDQGVMDLNLSNPASPALTATINPYPTSGLAARQTEGNGAYVAYAGPHQNLGLLSDEDWNAPNTTLRIDTPSSSSQGLTAGSIFGCEAEFTLFDPHDSAQIYRHAGSQVPAGAGATTGIVYAGRGCPIDLGFGTTSPDPYLNDASGHPVDLNGKIVVLDRRKSPNQASQGLTGGGCSFAEKTKRAQDNGAIGVVFDASFPPGNAFSPDGDPTGLTIPVMALDQPGVTQLRNTLCPSTSPAGSGNCAAGSPVTGAMVDRPGGTVGDPGGWGRVRVIDQAGHAQVGQYKTPRSLVFPPPDLGVYAPGRAVANGNQAYVAWNSDGLQVLDLAHPAKPVAVGRFVPPDTPDPTGVIPSKAYVVGVALDQARKDNEQRQYVVITDINSGLYVLATSNNQDGDNRDGGNRDGGNRDGGNRG